MSENRRFQRIQFDCKVEFETESAQQVCELLDISLKGALLDQCSCQEGIGAACRLVLTLDESAEIKIVMQGVIAHQSGTRVGIHCQSIDLDSMTHLRKLVELNLGDEQLLQREFEALLPED